MAGLYMGDTAVHKVIFDVDGTDVYEMFVGMLRKDIAEITFPDGITNIREYAFYGCTNLNINELPESILDIGYGAFAGCSNITTLTFKGTPTTISTSAFNKCYNLTTINVPWSEGALDGAPWGATNATINYNYTEGA